MENYRIGHGTCIHPSLGGSDTLWKLLLEHKSAVEVCLSSNVFCQTVPSFQQHQVNQNLFEAEVTIDMCCVTVYSCHLHHFKSHQFLDII